MHTEASTRIKSAQYAGDSFLLFKSCTILFHIFYRKLMCLHLLPKGKIPAAFGELRLTVEDITNRDERQLVKKLCAYVDETWIDKTMWPPSKWSVHMQKVKNKIKINYEVCKCIKKLKYRYEQQMTSRVGTTTYITTLDRNILSTGWICISYFMSSTAKLCKLTRMRQNCYKDIN